MISIKGGTQTWSKSAQESSLDVDKTQTMSATDKQKALGDKDLGTVLNEIADPNWVDPQKMRKVGNDQLDKDAFLKLFLAQLKNQDPTNPMESHDLAAQLAQFTQLEKLNNIDKGISSMAQQKSPTKSYDSLNLIGKTISGDTSKIFRTDSTENHEIGFDIKENAAEANVSIRNRFGDVIKTLELRDLKAGKNEVTWNGEDEHGRAVSDGEYNVVIEAKASNGSKVFADTKFDGKVTGVKYTATGPVLLMGNKTIRMTDVKKISVPEVEDKKADVNKPTVKENTEPQSKTVLKPEDGQQQRQAQVAEGNLEQVGMSRGFINKLEKTADVKGVN